MNNNLTFDDVAKALKVAKSIYDLKEDINFYNENNSDKRGWPEHRYTLFLYGA